MTTKRMVRRTLLSTALAAALTAPAAHATVGYFQHGYGDRSKAMGGVGIAYPQDSIAAAINPAGMVLIGDRMDFGTGVFRPVRDATVSNNGGVGDGSYDLNQDSTFPLGHFGYNRMLSPSMSFGVSVYGNGGMNTSVDGNALVLLSGAPNVAQGVDLMQLFVAPTLAFKVNDSHAIGISVVLAAQRFKANGLAAFTDGDGDGTPDTIFTVDPANLTNRGYDMSTGAGLRVGWIGQLSPNVSVGATFATKTYMSKFDKYKGLFAEGGDFDIPANFGVGLAFKASDRTVVAVDVMRILYSDVKAVGNRGIHAFLAGQVGRLGSSNGMGFGWRDVTAVKVGISHQYSSRLTLRAGFTYNTQPIPSSEALFNYLAPGVIQKHLTLGATWKLANGGELTLSYFHAFKEKVKGAGAIPNLTSPPFPAPIAGAFNGGDVDLEMYQDAIGISYGRPLK